MTKRDNDEIDLTSLYQARKKQYKSPAALKRKVLKEAMGAKYSTRFFSGFQQVAIAAGTLLLISLVAIQYYDFNHSQPQLTYTLVEVHSIGEQENNQYAEISRKYDQHYQQFKQKQALLVSHHSKSAVLNQMEGGWELVTCDKELLKVSDELVNTLKEMDLIGDTLQAGDNVNIAFNRYGLIVGIHQSKLNKSC